MVCPLQAHVLKPHRPPKPSLVFWFLEWIVVDPKEHGER